MVSKKFTVFFSFFICLSGSVLFGLKYSVMSIEDRIHYAKKALEIEKKNQHILRAEWKALTTPDRIQKLTLKYLPMKQIEPKQLKEYDSSLFHNNNSKNIQHKKRLSKLISEILSHEDEDD